MKKIAIVTGATGEIGFALTKEAIRKGFKVLAFGRDTQKLENIKNTFGEDVETYAADLSDQARIRKVLSSIREKFSSIELLVGAAGTFAWDADFEGDTPEAKREAATTFLREVNFSSKVRFINVLREVYGGSISPVVKVVGSHIADPAKFSDEDISARRGEWGYALPMKELRQYILDRRSDENEKWDFRISEPGLVDTAMARKSFNMDTLGFDPDWSTAMSPDEYAKEFFIDV